jgi:glycosyltransferase involved in cell wall biosynthesis
VRDGETGFVVESGDVAGAADAMVRLLTDDALCTRMGEAAGTFVAAERSLDAAADRYVELVRTWVAASDRKGSAS